MCRRTPARGGLRTTEPAIASTGMARKKRPISMQRPRVVWYHPLVTVSPAKADPLLLLADVKA